MIQGTRTPPALQAFGDITNSGQPSFGISRFSSHGSGNAKPTAWSPGLRRAEFQVHGTARMLPTSLPRCRTLTFSSLDHLVICSSFAPCSVPKPLGLCDPCISHKKYHGSEFGSLRYVPCSSRACCWGVPTPRSRYHTPILLLGATQTNHDKYHGSGCTSILLPALHDHILPVASTAMVSKSAQFVSGQLRNTQSSGGTSPAALLLRFLLLTK